tara:strand:+ start:215 stop:478 length:264 start_codon:yes stop_codon:yes gene_type:complete
MTYDEWETTGWVYNKALNEVEVPIIVFYFIENDDQSYPVIEEIGSYEDEDGYKQDYLLSDMEVERAYERIYEAMQEAPIYDEYGGSL